VSRASRLCARFGRFNLVGLLGAALQVLLFDFLMKCCGLPGIVAAPVAVELVLLHNFFWHERFTWRDRVPGGRRQRALRLCRFHAANGLLSLAGNTALIYCLVEKLKAPALPSALAAIALCAPLNFLLSDQWIFKSQLHSVRLGRRKGSFCGSAQSWPRSRLGCWFTPRLGPSPGTKDFTSWPRS